ncbi:hypothetical protein FOFC_16123 [Fusarium oxysporum]|nr:hypothetical protein FOFC_16123 [Fusarium oxysporum]
MQTLRNLAAHPFPPERRERRSRDATLTLRNLASAERCAPKRTDGDAGLPPPNERSGTQPTSPEKLRQRHAARRLFRESLSQPHVVLGTPIPPTQQSTRRFRALAPSPPVQPTAHPIASHSDPSTVRSSTTGLGYSYLAARFHKGGKDSQDEPSKAVARAKQAAIQRDHRSRRRVGETVSLTPTISQLGVFGDFEGPGEDASQDRLQPSELLGGDEIRKEGDDRGQFSESDIDAEDYFNLLLSPARPRRYLKQLGVESDPDLGDEHENSDNDCVDGSPLRHRLRQPSARPRRGRRGPAPGTGGRPRKSPRQARSSMPPRRIRSPVIIPPEELAVFHAQDPVWNGDLDACALTDRDKATLREFWTTLDNDQMEYCTRCQECWFQMKIDSDGICERCYRKDRKRRPDEPYFFSADNQLDFGPVPARLPQLTPTEESLLARVHVHVNIMLVRGQQYKYRGHVVHFLREVGLVYNQLPLLPQELNTVLLRPANTSSHANLSRQFTRQFRVRRQPVVIWLDYLRRHHPGYRCVVIDEERLNQLPQDGNVLDAIPQSQVETADVGPDSPEEDQEAEPDLEDEAAVPDLLAKDTELDALRSILSGESGADSELSTSFQAQAQHELQLPNIRHTPINEFNRSHALLSLAFPCLFPDGRADFVEPRLRSIDYRDYVEHAMRWHDGRFARHPTFRFVAFNTLMRSQARSRSRFFVKQQDGRQQPLTREQLIQALEHSEDPEAQALINSITRHAVSIRGTRPFWNKRRQDLEAYAYNLGCPGAFITFSPADLHWRSLYQHMPQYDDWLAATEPERMALSRRLLRQNPHIAAFHFYRRYCLFRDIVLSKKFNITDYWDRYEWQGRGSPHNHGLYWMDSCPGTDMDDEAARDVFARTWGFHVTAINPEPSRAMPQGEGNPLSVDPLSIEMTFLRLSQIVNRCQRHKCNTTYCLRVRKRTGDLARDMEGAAADIEAANVANPERECRFDFPRALRELAAVIRKEGRSYYVFEAARNDSLMNHFNPAIILGWLANIDISPCTSLQAVITYAAKYCSKSEKKTEPYCKLADQVLPHTAHLQPLLSFSSRLMNKLIAERDYSAQEISHLLLNIPLQEGTRMVVVVDCRPLELHGRSYRVDEDVIETVGSYRKYLERNDQHEDVTYLEYLQSYNLKTWRRLAANAKKRVLSYFPRYKSIEASPQFNDFCRVKLMMAHPHRSPRELLVMDGQRFDSFAAVYKFCRQLHHTHADDHYGDPDAKELRAEDDEFEPEAHEEPVTEEDWHELARMLPDRPLEEEDIDILGRRDIDINYDWTSHIGRYTDDGILNGDYWKQRKAENLLDLDVDDQPLEARDSLNPEQRLVYDTVMDHFLTQNPSQLLLHVDGGGGTGKSYLINLLSAHLQAATGGRGTPVWRAAPTGKPLYYDKEVQGVEIKGRNAYRRFDKTVFLKVVQRQRGDDQEAFRTALGELRLLQLSKESWKLLSSRVQAKLDDREVARFVNALRVYATKDRVNEYNHYHLDRLSRPAIQVTAKNVGSGAAAAPDDKAGNLAKQIPICLGARLMLTSNLWQPVGLCNGARGTVYDIGWAPGAEPIQDPPCVIMMEFDKYNGPVFLTTPDGKKIVPILPVERDFLIGATLCTRTQFPLIVCYAITVHKSQSITEDMIVTDLSCRDFQTGLSYVAVSRVKTLEGLMLDAPFDRNHLIYASPPDGDSARDKKKCYKIDPSGLCHGHLPGNLVAHQISFPHLGDEHDAVQRPAPRQLHVQAVRIAFRGDYVSVDICRPRPPQLQGYALERPALHFVVCARESRGARQTLSADVVLLPRPLSLAMYADTQSILLGTPVATSSRAGATIPSPAGPSIASQEGVQLGTPIESPVSSPSPWPRSARGRYVRQVVQPQQSAIECPVMERRFFELPDPDWMRDLSHCPLSDRDKELLEKFWTELENDGMEHCACCQEIWFNMGLKDGICKRCIAKDKNKKEDEPWFFSAENQLDFGLIPAFFPQLTIVEEMLIARVHVFVNVMQAWLDFLSNNHPGYRGITVCQKRMSVLPEDGDVLDQVATAAVTDPLSANLGNIENDDVEPDEVDQSAVPDLLPEDTEMEALRSHVLGEERGEHLPVRPSTQHQLDMPDIRRTPINEFNQLQALLSLAFPTLFPRGQADFVEPRLRPIKYADYIQHALRWHDGTMADLPVIPLSEAFQNPESAEAQQLLNSINRQTAQLRGTRPYWYRKRQELESYAYNLDCPGAFITFSPADLHWRSLYQHLPQFQDWQELPEQQRMGMSSKLLRDNPHIAAWHFYKRFGLFRDIVLKQKFNVTDCWNSMGRQILPYVSHQNPLLSFASRLMNKLLTERDFSGQEICHVLLNCELQEGTRVIRAVDCRPYEQQGRSLRLQGDHDDAEVVGIYEKYLSRPPLHEELTYLDFLANWNTSKRDGRKWTRWSRQAKPRVLYYFPRYKSNHQHHQYDDFCRVKLMLAHPHRDPNELRKINGVEYNSYASAAEFCYGNHRHPDDYYGTPNAEERRPDPDEFEEEFHEPDLLEEDWLELARQLPDCPPSQEAIDLLGRRDIDIQYDWTPHVGRYADPGIVQGDYWRQRIEQNRLYMDVEDMPLEVRDALNPEQRIVYDTFIGHFQCGSEEQILLHVDGGGGTGKSYMIKVLSSHLQRLAGNRPSPIWRAAPTGVASNQIMGTTLHSLLRLPMDRAFTELSPADANAIQKKLRDVRYLVIDEKSMLGLRQLSWIDKRLRQVFPARAAEFFGGISIILVGDFFQLPPIANKPLYFDGPLKDLHEVSGQTAYRAFNHTVFLKKVQRQQGDDQAGFRLALEELRGLKLSIESWKLLSQRVQVKLSQREEDTFDAALRIYSKKARVNEYNYEHLVRLKHPAIQVMAKNIGNGADKATSEQAGNLAGQFPVCIGARLMLTQNIWQPAGLVNGAQGTVYDIGWAPGADAHRDPPSVIMMVMDKYTGPSYLTTDDGREVVPILPVKRDFFLGTSACTRKQFPLMASYAITVHKSQSITVDKMVTDLSERDFQTGLSYVAVSRVKMLDGLMIDAPFERASLHYEKLPDGKHSSIMLFTLEALYVLTD